MSWCRNHTTAIPTNIKFAFKHGKYAFKLLKQNNKTFYVTVWFYYIADFCQCNLYLYKKSTFLYFIPVFFHFLGEIFTNES